MSIKEIFDWKFVSKLVVRKTGFPFEMLEQLQWEKTNTIIKEMIPLQKEKDTLSELLINKMIPELVLESANQDKKEMLHLLSRLRKFLVKGVIRQRELTEAKDLFGEKHELTNKMNKWIDLDEKINSEMEKAKITFEYELSEKRQLLQEVFKNPYIAEAVYISNPDVFNISYPKFLLHQEFEKRPSKIRTLEMRFYSYLQRFCSKNDTASFFGPMNYAKWDMDLEENMKLVSKNGKYSERIVHYSFWMVKELAKSIEQEDDIRPYLIPKLHPMCSYEEDKVSFIHLNKSITLPSSYLKLLAAVSTDSISIKELSDKLNVNIEIITKHIDQLVKKKILIQEIEIPSTTFDPFAFLYSWIQELPQECKSKQKWLNIFKKFLTFKEEVLAKDLKHRQHITLKMEELFEKVTYSSSRRNQGQMYADRTLYYEECKGTIEEMSFGRLFYEDFMERIKPVFDLSAAYGDVMRDYYQTIALRIFEKINVDRSKVPYMEFIFKSKEYLEAGKIDLSFTPLKDFYNQLNELISKRRNGSIAELTKEDIEKFNRYRKYEECHTSPDIMFSAKNVKALENGDYKIVLGEVHQFISMWGSQLLFDSDRTNVNEEINELIEEMPTYRRLSVILNTRRHKGLIHESFPGTIIQLFGIPSDKASNVINIRDLYVQKDKDTLNLIDSDGETHYLYNSGDENVHLWAFAPSRVSSPTVQFSKHTPRIEINGVIFQRERWEINKEEIDNQLDSFTLYIAMQKLRDKYNIPRYVFFKVNSEKKPYYFDFENFFSIEMLQSLLRKNEKVTFIEMEPSPTDLWLQDEDGKYCFEMRGTVFQNKLS